MIYRVWYTRRGNRTYLDMETRTDATVFATWGHASGTFYDPKIEPRKELDL